MDGPIRRNQLEQELSEKKALVTKRETNVKTVSQELIKVIDVLSGKDLFIKIGPNSIAFHYCVWFYFL